MQAQAMSGAVGVEVKNNLNNKKHSSLMHFTKYIKNQCIDRMQQVR
jgi:hypothetical protein